LRILQSRDLRILHPVGRRFLTDLAVASAILPQTLERAQQGAAANVWGESFEHQVQDLIDNSPWRPPDRFRSLIKKKIREQGRTITDIDAVAVRGNTLLLIDCKAFQATDAFMRGEYGAVETMRRKVEEASEAWHSRIQLIRSRPELLGIQIPANYFLEGLVVIPFVPFVRSGPAMARVGDLLHVSSINEVFISALYRSPTEKGTDANRAD
jgi:hypothetical protein